ncbi:MAG: hypothetical protein KGL39_30155 [Patescibacteria group bacterium]|nr:hypothetical protein [Patescibacteria group bacterium]
MKKTKHKPVKDYILLEPDKPKAGNFHIENIINETATVVAVGPLCSKEYKDLVGKQVIFNAWACDEKTVNGEKFYFAPESANVVCATI